MKPYSIDLRKKVIESLLKNNRQYIVADTFGIGIATVRRWWKLYKENDGNIETKKPITTKPRKVDYEVIRQYISHNPDKTQKEIAAYFGIKNVWYIIKQLNITYKKKTIVRGASGRFTKRVQEDT